MRRQVGAAAIVGLLFLGLGADSAYAVFGIADTSDGILANLLANGIQELNVARQQLQTLKSAYDETKRISQVAHEAVSLAQSFQRFSVARFGQRFQNDITWMYPDVGVIRRDVLGASGMGSSSWATSTGAVSSSVQYCLPGAPGSGTACTQLRQGLGTSQVLAALSGTFGKPPANPSTTREKQAVVVDAEVGAALKSSHDQEERAKKVKLEVDELLKRCDQITPGTNQTECQQASQRAQVRLLQEQNETNVRLAEQSRLQALAIEQRNADLKRELAEAAARRDALSAGADTLGRQAIQIKSGGVDF